MIKKKPAVKKKIPVTKTAKIKPDLEFEQHADLFKVRVEREITRLEVGFLYVKAPDLPTAHELVLNAYDDAGEPSEKKAPFIKWQVEEDAAEECQNFNFSVMSFVKVK
jgi:hypothetical protein